MDRYTDFRMSPPNLAMAVLAICMILSLNVFPQTLLGQDSSEAPVEVNYDQEPKELDSEELSRSFISGTQAYDSGDFEKAREKYQEIYESGFQSGVLFYNLGNTYFRLNNLGEAVLHYERALRQMPNNEALLHNLRVARAKTANRFRLLPKPFWNRAWSRLIFIAKPTGFLMAGLGLYLLGILFLIYRVWIGYRHEWVRRIWMWSLLFGLIFLILAFAANRTLNTQKAAVVMDTKTPLFDNPDNLQRSDLELHEGLTVDLLDSRDGLVHVRLPDGHTGWISSNAVKEI